jgi:hypothetical protein
MPITITITGDTMPEVTAQLYAILHGVEPVIEKPKSTQKAVERLMQGTSVVEPKPAKRAVASPVASPDPVDDLMEDEAGFVDIPLDTHAVKALSETKEAVLVVLQKAFADGKVKQVRELLKNYGNGAKSFPEVALDAFPGIQKAIDAGALHG